MVYKLKCPNHDCVLKRVRVYDETKKGGYKSTDLLYCEMGDHIFRQKLEASS